MMARWRKLEGLSRTRRAIWEVERPWFWSAARRAERVLSTLQQRSFGSRTTTEAMSGGERPRPESKASTASGLAGDFRWESALEALRA
uniref:Uncharacterized protein n=1 Tax=Arundo donax TaxID=35708 RepID=A0A0A8XN32_ARUDO